MTPEEIFMKPPETRTVNAAAAAPGETEGAPDYDVLEAAYMADTDDGSFRRALAAAFAQGQRAALSASEARAREAEDEVGRLTRGIEALAVEWEQVADRRARDASTAIKHSPAHARALNLGASFERAHAVSVRALASRHGGGGR